MSNLQIVFLVLAASLSLFWLLLAVTRPRPCDLPNVVAVLRYGAVVRSLALILALLPPMVMIYAIALFPWRNDSTLTLAGASFLATSLIAGLFLIETARAQIALTEDGITRFSPWTGPLTLKWIEIEGVRYSAANRWFVVTGAGKTIRVSRHLEGINIFVATLRRRIAAERLASASAIFDALK